MGASQIMSTLQDKRSELADAINRLERQANQHRADLAHITATMRLSFLQNYSSTVPLSA